MTDESFDESDLREHHVHLATMRFQQYPSEASRLRQALHQLRGQCAVARNGREEVSAVFAAVSDGSLSEHDALVTLETLNNLDMQNVELAEEVIDASLSPPPLSVVS